ncbi:hypothetical protein NQ317_013252 [Molorchus minor]|uniref:Uncharacterized protein n=1 Tax=Molorchus minor TaxID=1323400 RepID=A0ABQ9K0D2_9CUCU|nr:hypothetical protein NQ317_013252 [Molorchus minor]
MASVVPIRVLKLYQYITQQTNKRLFTCRKKLKIPASSKWHRLIEIVSVTISVPLPQLIPQFLTPLRHVFFNTTLTSFDPVSSILNCKLNQPAELNCETWALREKLYFASWISLFGGEFQKPGLDFNLEEMKGLFMKRSYKFTTAGGIPMSILWADLTPKRNRYPDGPLKTLTAPGPMKA